MSSVEQVVEQSLLYDFYGELLTEHQRGIYEAALFEDYSLSEIAEEAGISRQGVHDLIRRCDKQLRGYEAKLHLVERFTGMKQDVLEIMKLANAAEYTVMDRQSADTFTEIKRIAGKLMEEL